MVLLMSIVTYTSPQPPNLKLHTKFLNSNQVFDLYRFGNYTRRSLYSIIGISQKLNSFIRWSDANSILYLNTNLDSLGYGEKASRISLHQIVKKRMMNECEQMDCKAKWRSEVYLTAGDDEEAGGVEAPTSRSTVFCALRSICTMSGTTSTKNDAPAIHAALPVLHSNCWLYCTVFEAAFLAFSAPADRLKLTVLPQRFSFPLSAEMAAIANLRPQRPVKFKLKINSFLLNFPPLSDLESSLRAEQHGPGAGKETKCGGQ